MKTAMRNYEFYCFKNVFYLYKDNKDVEFFIQIVKSLFKLNRVVKSSYDLKIIELITLILSSF